MNTNSAAPWSTSTDSRYRRKASMCPLRKSKLSGYCYVPREGDGVQNRQCGEGSGLVPVKVNVTILTAMIDTGSSLSLIRKGHVPVNDIDYSHQTLIQCVHGDQSQQPTAELTVEIQGQKYLLKVGVMEKLTFEMIWGRDVPIHSDLLGSVGGQLNEQSVCQSDVNVSCSVVTHAQAKVGVQPLSVLCEGGTKGPRKSRRQQRLEKYVGTPVPVADVSGLDVQWDVPQHFATLQKPDATLKGLFDKALAGDSQSSCGGIYTVDNHILYLGSEADSRKLVVPSTCRPLVLNLAHIVPWAGHLGQHKTYLRLPFLLALMYTDVQTYCKTCPTCQKTSAVRRSDRAPLCSLPVISTPFKRIAMDIVGPLEKSSAGYKYILVICDYATRFPEAFPLRSITTPKIIIALVQLFSHVGIPDEILTGQETNFTSQLMVQLHRQLGIKGLRTTPYYPQMDGLVERFNQTLKNMLRKFVADTGISGYPFCFLLTGRCLRHRQVSRHSNSSMDGQCRNHWTC
uniref:Gypsy retrotransposon integrase-like protein 1 n=1 Tax=Salmo trutta TaxID=8032 RepID=A0A673Y1W5_SALTR